MVEVVERALAHLNIILSILSNSSQSRTENDNDYIPSEEHGHGVTTGVGGNDLADLDGVVCQEVVQYEVTRVAKHVVGVVPVAVEAQNVSVVVEELLQGIVLLVGSQWHHCILQLRAVGSNINSGHTCIIVSIG